MTATSYLSAIPCETCWLLHVPSPLLVLQSFFKSVETSMPTQRQMRINDSFLLRRITDVCDNAKEAV